MDKAVKEALSRIKVWERSSAVTPHAKKCFVYRNAHRLIGVDRRGLCTCGAEAINDKNRLAASREH